MTKLDVQELLPLFGLSLESSALQSCLVERDFNTALNLPKLRKQGSQEVSDPKRGIDLLFSERQEYLDMYGTPKSDGEAVFSALVVHLKANNNYQPYAGFVGGSLDGVRDAKSLRNALGAGKVRDEDEGVIYEESWRMGEVNLFASYSDSGEIKSLQFNVPMLEK